MPLEIVHERKSGESAKDFVYRVLKYNITSLILPPNDTIEEFAIATQLSVSRTPVREAILALMREELIEVFPQRSTKVTRIDINIIDQSIFGIKALEDQIIKDACNMIHHGSIDTIKANIEQEKAALEKENIFELATALYKFHNSLFVVFHKEKLFCVFDRFFYHIVREWMLEISMVPFAQLIEHQEAIVNAIKQHNCNDAIMHHTFYVEHLKCDHESLKIAFPSYFLN